jgi:hypothetical protein
VHVLVHDKERQLFVSQRVNERPTILGVSPVGSRSYLTVLDSRLADHEQASEQSKHLVTHKAHMNKLDALLSSQSILQY